jgi:hypothetical protein
MIVLCFARSQCDSLQRRWTSVALPIRRFTWHASIHRRGFFLPRVTAPSPCGIPPHPRPAARLMMSGPGHIPLGSCNKNLPGALARCPVVGRQMTGAGVRHTHPLNHVGEFAPGRPRRSALLPCGEFIEQHPATTFGGQPGPIAPPSGKATGYFAACLAVRPTRTARPDCRPHRQRRPKRVVLVATPSHTSAAAGCAVDSSGRGRGSVLPR